MAPTSTFSRRSSESRHQVVAAAGFDEFVPAFLEERCQLGHTCVADLFAGPRTRWLELRSNSSRLPRLRADRSDEPPVFHTVTRNRFARLADRIAGVADTRGEFAARLEEIPAPGHAGFGPKCARHSDLRTRGLNRVQSARPVSDRHWLSSSPLRRPGVQRPLRSPCKQRMG